MTYCCGILVRDGLVMIADTRTNAGLDYLRAAPVRGTRYGGGGETLKVAVNVEQAQRQSQS